MADEKKDKKTSEGSTDFFLNFMKKRREQEPKKEIVSMTFCSLI